MSDDFTFREEPKKNFLNLLVRNIGIVEEMLFVRRLPLQTSGPLRGIIASLDERSKNHRSKYKDDLESWEQNPKQVTRMDIEEAYSSIMNFLHKTWLKEFSVKPLNPRSRHIKEKKR
ncbi:hypothetical protein GTO27_05725 [Candidatus Bathyarchaeota archaeon]|nr:hypothetical protein [Candidatus Bathyarchaeota archaeon]